MARLIDADKYMARLRANIDTTADTIDEQIKKDEPIGTVKDGGQIGYLLALQWVRSLLEQDCYTVEAIPKVEAILKDNVYNAIQEMMKYEHEGFINISLTRLDEILKRCGVCEDEKDD